MRIADVSWRSRFPPGIDEQLVVYDDGTAWLVARHGRENAAAIGSYASRPVDADLSAPDDPGLSAGDNSTVGERGLVGGDGTG